MKGASYVSASHTDTSGHGLTTPEVFRMDLGVPCQCEGLPARSQARFAFAAMGETHYVSPTIVLDSSYHDRQIDAISNNGGVAFSNETVL